MNNITKTITAAAMSAVIVTAGFEGYSEFAYQDSAGVWTICYGETKGVYEGLHMTKQECDATLKKSLMNHSRPLRDLPSDTPTVVILGSLDFTYNIGVAGFNSSTVKKELLQGNYKAAGAAVLKWKYITVGGVKVDCSKTGNRQCGGLWARRQWQSKAIGNWYHSVYAACTASTEVLGAKESVCTPVGQDFIIEHTELGITPDEQ